MGFVSQAKKGVVWTFLQQFSVQLINFVVQIVLARILLPADFGLIAMITIFIAIGQSLSDSGMTSSLIRSKDNTERDYGTVFLTNLAVSIFVYLIVYLIAPFVALFYNQPILTDLLRAFGLVFILSSFYVVQLAKFSKELNFKSQFVYQLPSVFIGATVGIYMAKNGYGVWSLIGLNISQAFSFALILWVFYRWKPKLIFDKSVFRHHFDYGYKLTLSGLLNTIYLNLYRVIIGKRFSPANVGFFTQADSLRLFPVNQLSAVLNKVTFPLFASIQNDDRKLKEAYKSALRLVLSITSAMMLILVLIAKPLFLVVFGDKWLPSVPYFQILCIASIFLPIGTYNLNILKVKGRSDLFLKVEVIKKVIGVISLLVCIPFGIEAIVWSLCLTNIFFAYLNGYFSGKFISYPVLEQLKNSLSIIIVAILPFLSIYYLVNNIVDLSNRNDLYLIFIQALSFIVMYLPLVYIFNKPLLRDLKLVLKR
ncbi:lipopolysaccharide biosynthesis protein [Sphingobacterium faecium NBRC 15299]|uniref:lipopolysaccharide biosynthesis protein n=1 Tax=Sphingobacterium faecium TaxID=34087 RepID=UPI000D390219|nr:lipopolysaccharide biosynthesis protein [Sphingobacterium faecium]PTX12468.1 O-antigen/teichoic acid export membrane protein [Sphingobacterium faecium]GEM62177.1 lipopolysaccharide biosynthesis protein [Sphingobacterium faecium NBRC 15299]